MNAVMFKYALKCTYQEAWAVTESTAKQMQVSKLSGNLIGPLLREPAEQHLMRKPHFYF